MGIGKKIKSALSVNLDRVFSLEIGDRSIKIIELTKLFKYSIFASGHAELPSGVVEDGIILDKPVLAESVKTILRNIKPRKLSTNRVMVSLPASQVFTKSLEVDINLKGTKLSNFIVEKMVLCMPVDPNKTYWDFIERPLADKTKKLIVYFGVRKDVANDYVGFCNSLGLEVVSLCLDSINLSRVILRDTTKHGLIINIGARFTNLSFFDMDGEINMAVSIPVAGDHITGAIMKARSINGVEAEAMKVRLGLKEGNDNVIRTIIAPIFEEILSEIKQALIYYENTFKQKIDLIILTGGSSLLPGVDAFIKISLNKEVRIATSHYKINLDLLPEKEKSFPIFANVVGSSILAASGDFKEINLLKKMPRVLVNYTNKLSLFNMGYLNKINTFRAIINNRFILIIMVLLVGVIFAVLLQQTKIFGLNENEVLPVNLNYTPKEAVESGTTTPSVSVASTSTTTSRSIIPK